MWFVVRMVSLRDKGDKFIIIDSNANYKEFISKFIFQIISFISFDISFTGYINLYFSIKFNKSVLSPNIFPSVSVLYQIFNKLSKNSFHKFFLMIFKYLPSPRIFQAMKCFNNSLYSILIFFDIWLTIQSMIYILYQ